MDAEGFEAFSIDANLEFNQDSIKQSVNDFKSEPIIPDTDASYENSIQLPITSNQGKNIT